MQHLHTTFAYHPETVQGATLRIFEQLAAGGGGGQGGGTQVLTVDVTLMSRYLLLIYDDVLYYALAYNRKV